MLVALIFRKQCASLRCTLHFLLFALPSSMAVVIFCAFHFCKQYFLLLLAVIEEDGGIPDI